ncbi:MAG TPA: hypoxanthine-guanine phosphoribosyltransferase [Pseudomonadales bacterium]
MTARVPTEILTAREAAELVVGAQEVQAAIDRTAVRLAVALEAANPLVLCLLNGGLPFTAELIKRFSFPLELSYLHATRYGQRTSGSQLEWLARPPVSVAGRHVLLVDDIFDAGETLMQVVEWLRREGAVEVTTAVLVDKAVPRSGAARVDYAALCCPDRYLFGCGMDFRGYWRNLPAIYALPRSLEDEAV